MERILMFVMLLGISGSVPIPGYVPDDSFCIQKVNGNYEYPAPHCSYFYQCVDGLTYILECYSKSLYYNQDTDRCDWHWSFPDEKRAECGLVDQKLQGNSRPARAVASKSDDAVFCRGRPDGNYEYPAPECYKFYACSNGYTYVMQCPSKGFYYNPENDQCDWPYNLPPQRQAECEGREYTGDGVEGTKPTATPSSTRPSHGPSDPFCEGKDDGNYEHPAPNCSLYYACSNGNAHILRCATDELYFDQVADRCDWYYNFPEEKQAACEGREYTGVGEAETKTVPSPTQPSDGPSDDPFCEDKVDGNYEYPAPNCSLYYACSNGLTYIMECGEGGLYYNQSSDRCEWSWSFPEEKQSECEGRSYTDEPVEETTDDPSGPEEIIDDEDTFCSDKVDANYEYPAPNCSQFYSCSNGRTHVMNCYPNSLYYHQQLDRCEWPSNFSESKQRECQGLPPLEDLNNDEEKKRSKRYAGRFGYVSGVDVV